MSKIYERCREARRRTGLSQEALALDLGVSRGAIAQWEMEEGTTPSVDNLIALARRSGLAFEYLATGRGPKIFGEPYRVEEERAVYAWAETPEDAELAKVVPKLSTQRRRALLAFIRAWA